MRYIKKGQEPQSFANWKAQENDDWKPTYSTLSGEIKSDVHKALLKEQGYTCCYCGISITRDISHIEHLQPQNEKNPDSPKDIALAMDFTNLLASCGFSENYKISELRYKDVLHCLQHCGCKRGNSSLAITPLQADCTKFFRYTGSGEIRPVKDFDKIQPAIIDTIQTLTLNHNNLMAMREEAIKGAIEAAEDLAEDELKAFISSYEEPNQQAFSFAIAYILRQYLPIAAI
jgi:uncharacterized protein (TIGR02646 family)